MVDRAATGTGHTRGPERQTLAIQAVVSGLVLGARTVGRVHPLRRRIVRLVDRRLREQYARSIAVGGGAGVFMPYSPVNLRDLCARGKDLNDLWAEPFFARIREWQKEYDPRLRGGIEQPEGNLLRPCPIRDHHSEFRRMVREYGVRPTDSGSSQAARSPAYAAGLARFDRDLADLLDPIWQSDYLGSRPAKPRPAEAETSDPP